VDRVGVAVVASRGVLYAVADYERSVPVLTQTQVEAFVAGLLRRSGVDLTGDPEDARVSCVQERLAKSSRQPGFLMLWQGSELDRLPGALVDRISSGRYRQAAWAVARQRLPRTRSRRTAWLCCCIECVPFQPND